MCCRVMQLSWAMAVRNCEEAVETSATASPSERTRKSLSVKRSISSSSHCGESGDFGDCGCALLLCWYNLPVRCADSSRIRATSDDVGLSSFADCAAAL